MNQFLFSDIIKFMDEATDDTGALVCAPDVFTFIYSLEKNRCKRFTQSIYMTLITFVHEEGDFPSDKILDDEMDYFLSALKKTLRSTDIVCRWNKNQYILMHYKLKDDDVQNIYKRVNLQYTPLNKGFNYIQTYRKIE